MLADSRTKRARMFKNLFLFYLYCLVLAVELSSSAPIRVGRSVKDTKVSNRGANAPSDAKILKMIQRFHQHVNLLRRRIAIWLPLADEHISLTSKTKEQISREDSPTDKRLEARPYFRSTRKLQSTMDTKSLSSSASCVDVTSFVTFVNKNVRDCSWVKSQGRCDTYGTFCPVTCYSCDPNDSLEQALNQNLQVEGSNTSSNSDTPAANSSNGGEGGDNDSNSVKEDATDSSQKTTNKNKSPATNYSLSDTDSSTVETSNVATTAYANVTSKSSAYNRRNSTASPLSSDLILVKFSFTTLTDSQRKSLTDGTLPINDIKKYLVTAVELNQEGNGTGAKILEAILMSVSKILNSETINIISDDDNISSLETESKSQTSALLLFYNQSLTNNEIANDGSGGWVDLSLPYQVIAMSSDRRSLRNVSSHQVNEFCNDMIRESITDGTLLQMLTLSTNGRIKAVSISQDKVGATPKPRSKVSRFFQETNGPTLFAIGVCSAVLLCLVVLWASITTSKMKQRKHWKNYERSSENKKPTNGSDHMIDTTFDSSAPPFAEGSCIHSSVSMETSLNSGHTLKPTVTTSSVKDLSDISSSSSWSGRLNNIASDVTAKMSHRLIPSLRKLIKPKSSEDGHLNSSAGVQHHVTHSPELSHPQMHFHVASVSGPPSVLKHPEEKTNDEESTAGTIFGQIQRGSYNNVDDGTASAFMGSNNSYWGDAESPEDFDVVELDEVVFYDSESSSIEKISPSGSVHYVNTPDTGHSFTLSGFIEQVQDAVFEALYSSDSTSNEITSLSDDANESSRKSLSSILSESPTLPIPDTTNNYRNPNEITSSDNSTEIIKTHDVVSTDIIPKSILKNKEARSTAHTAENTNKTCCDGPVQVCYQEISEAFSSFWNDPRDVTIARRKLLTYPTQNK